MRIGGSALMLTLFNEILNMSLRASIIILIILCIKKLINKAPKIFSYMLWSVVLFRLLCPISFEAPLSIIPERVNNGMVLNSVADKYIGEHKVYQDSTEEYNEAIRHGAEPIVVLEKGQSKVGAYVVTSGESVSDVNTVFNTVFPVLCKLWMVGVVVLFFYHVICYIKLKKKLVGAVPYDEEEDIYFSDYINIPFVIGFLEPRIYLPSILMGQKLDYVLLHERHHIDRKDYIFKVIGLVAVCVHWFNPLVWLAFTLACADMEMSCDEAVLKHIGKDASVEYCDSLLGFAAQRAFWGIAIAFGEGNIKDRIKNVLQWKKTPKKILVLSTIICAVTIIVCMMNPKDNTIIHPHKWTSRLSVTDIDSYTAAKWGSEVVYYITEKEIADLVYVLNELSVNDFQQGNAIDESEFTIALTCDNNEYLLTYGSGITMISSEQINNKESRTWRTENASLSRCIRRIMINSLQVSREIPQEPLMPFKEDVLRMRRKVLKGMSNKEIKRLEEIVQVNNQYGERLYIDNNHFNNMKDPDGLEWDLLTQRGDVIVGYAFTSTAPEYDPEGEMTLEEYNRIYGEKVVYSDNEPRAEKLYRFLEEAEILLKNDLLADDFEAMRECMELAIQTHDVNYLYKIYYKLHDLDYFLLRYGPDDVGPYVGDDSCVKKYYGSLMVYNDFLPTIVEAYNQETQSYYKMSDGSWRTEVRSYKYKLDINGQLEGTSKDTYFTVLSNRKDVSLEEIKKASKDTDLKVPYYLDDETIIVFSRSE